jgi:HEAT repeat protein
MKTASFSRRVSEWIVVSLFLLLLAFCGGGYFVVSQGIVGQEPLEVLRNCQRYLRLIIEEPGTDPIHLDVDELVEQVLQADNSPKRSQAISQLSKGMSRQWAESAVPALIQVVQSGEVEQDRVSAVQAIQSMGKLAKDAIPTMFQCLGDANGQVRQTAVEFLVSFGGEVQASLQKELLSPDPRRFVAAAFAMSHYSAAPLVLYSGRLKSMTRDQDPTIRQQVAHTLGHMEMPGIDQHLRILLYDNAPEVRAEAVESVGLTCHRPKETLEILKPMLQDEEPVVRLTVVNTLCRCEHDQAIVKVIQEKVEQESDEETRAIMQQAMIRLQYRQPTEMGK